MTGGVPLTTPLWQAGGRPARRPALDGDAVVDVCVVGAGFTGLWTALHLVRSDPSLRVLVVEAGYAGFGASGRNGGWCSALFPLPLDALARRHGRDAALAMAAACREAVDDVARLAEEEGVDAQVRKGGTVVVARGPAGDRHARHEVAAAAADPGSGVELLDAAGVSEHVRVEGATSGTWTPHCASLHPYRLVTGLAAACERRGVRVVEGTRALAVRRGEVRTDHGTVRCGWVVLATEGYTPLLDRSRRRSVAPVYSLMVATPPLPRSAWDQIGLDRGQTFSEHRHLVVYGQRTADDRLAFGGRGAPYHWGSSVRPSFDQDPRVHHGLAAQLREYFPVLASVPGGRTRLAGIGVDHTWGGPLGIARDWHPAVRLDPDSRIAWAGGYVGDGVALSQLAGATLADLVTGRETTRTALPWVGHPARGWEPEPLRWLGVNAGLLVAGAADAHERRTGRPSPLGTALSRLTAH